MTQQSTLNFKEFVTALCVGSILKLMNLEAPGARDGRCVCPLHAHPVCCPTSVPHAPLLHAPGYRRASSGLNALPSFKGEPVLKQHGKALVAALAAIVEGNTSAIQRPLSCTTNAPPPTNSLHAI